MSHGTADSSAPSHPLALELTKLIRQTIGQTLRDAAQNADAASALKVPPAARASGPATLAQSHPDAGQRREAQALYGRCLAHYRSQVQKVLRPTQKDDDVGLAAAYFVLANLAAHEWRDPDPAALAPVEQQLRHLIAWTQAWETAGMADRQGLFEQLALLGVLINESRVQAKTQGDAARRNVQQAARGYLRQLLGLDPDLLIVTPQGLATADTVH